MPILKIHHNGDPDAVQATIKWLSEHGIPAGDAFVPLFVDTDEKVIYWSACVFPEGDEGYTNPETGVFSHGNVAASGLAKRGLGFAGNENGVVAVLQRTPTLSDPPAEVIAEAGV